MRYAGRDNLTEQMRETSDSKFVHNLITGADVFMKIKMICILI